jgi:methionine-rich copper-binding protein CopC
MRVPLSALIILSAGASCGSSGAASAHAIIVASTPAAGGTVRGPDVALSLQYNSRIDQERSRLTVEGSDGEARTVVLSKAASPDILTATATGLRPGDYKLRWQVLAVDGHITRGDIPFHVAAP